MTNLSQLYTLNNYKHHFWNEIQLISIELPLHVFSIEHVWPLKSTCILSRHLFLFLPIGFLSICQLWFAWNDCGWLSNTCAEWARDGERERVFGGDVKRISTTNTLSATTYTWVKIKYRHRQVSFDTFAQHVKILAYFPLPSNNYS